MCSRGSSWRSRCCSLQWHWECIHSTAKVMFSTFAPFLPFFPAPPITSLLSLFPNCNFYLSQLNIWLSKFATPFCALLHQHQWCHLKPHRSGARWPGMAIQHHLQLSINCQPPPSCSTQLLNHKSCFSLFQHLCLPVSIVWRKTICTMILFSFLRWFDFQRLKQEDTSFYITFSDSFISATDNQPIRPVEFGCLQMILENFIGESWGRNVNFFKVIF